MNYVKAAMGALAIMMASGMIADFDVMERDNDASTSRSGPSMISPMGSCENMSRRCCQAPSMKRRFSSMRDSVAA